jgi:hypothetical protein
LGCSELLQGDDDSLADAGLLELAELGERAASLKRDEVVRQRLVHAAGGPDEEEAAARTALRLDFPLDEPDLVLEPPGVPEQPNLVEVAQVLGRVEWVGEERDGSVEPAQVVLE